MTDTALLDVEVAGGDRLRDLAGDGPLVVVFVRHFG